MTAFGTDAIASLAANAVFGVDYGHDFTLNFIVVFIFVNDFALIIQGNQGHHAPSTGFETAPAAQARVPGNFLKKLRSPGISSKSQTSDVAHCLFLVLVKS
jgi:hypothetical protein